MGKQSYVVLDGAPPTVAGLAVRPGDTIMLTESEALYDRDMGRIALPGFLPVTKAVEHSLREAPADGIEKTALPAIADGSLHEFQAEDTTRAAGETVSPSEKMPLTTEVAERLADEKTGTSRTRITRR